MRKYTYVPTATGFPRRVGEIRKRWVPNGSLLAQVGKFAVNEVSKFTIVGRKGPFHSASGMQRLLSIPVGKFPTHVLQIPNLCT